MNGMATRYRHIEELYRSYMQHRSAIRQRLAEFAAVPPAEHFYELVYCLLTPQSSAENAAAAVQRLREAGNLECEQTVAKILSCREHYIRFHNTKARHIVGLQKVFPKVQEQLGNGCTSAEVRTWLVKNVKGIGWKEASHFLRNIGHRNLAILDRHILKHLKKHGVIRSVPEAMTAKRYLAIERRFQQFAEAVGIPLDELDLLFWSAATGQILK